MSEVGERMIRELQAIRRVLETSQPLGFGKKAQPVYVFVKHSPESLWYSRDKAAQENVPISERDLTGYLVNVWRFERRDDATGEVVPKLMVQVHADREYIIQSGLETNFSRSLLAGLLELEVDDLKNPITLVVEDNAGGRGRPTVFARLELQGQRLKPAFDRTVVVQELLEGAQVRFGFSSPYTSDDV